ncbi:MAG: nitrogen regulation protein NR(II), partial [Gammaproteobacteria bacterium]
RAINKVCESKHPLAERGVAFINAHGETVTIDCLITPFDDHDRFGCVLAELVQVDRKLKISREDELINLEAATRNLIRGLAHEIKNPLGGVRGAAQLLERELPDPELREYTQVIIEEADRLQNLVDRMLGPRNKPRFRVCNIHEVLERVRTLQTSDTGTRVVIHRDYDPSIPDIHGDPDLLIQAILNIVRNACQAMEGSGTLTLRTRVHRQFTIGSARHKKVIRVSVIDTGPGIPEDLQYQLFYPMVTGRPDGTGLGLSISQSLINQHGGLIEFDSEPGHTEFTIYLPINPKLGGSEATS